MIQDLGNSVFNNQFANRREAKADDFVFAFNLHKEVLIKEVVTDNDPVVLPKAKLFEKTSLIYLFSIDDKAYFLSKEAKLLPGFAYKSVQILRKDNPRVTSFALATAFHLFTWYQKTQYCGACASKLVPSTQERAMICPHCGQIYYPTIAPAIIVAITDGDKVVVTTYKDRVYRGVALIAGFCEIGESAEATAKREAFEEVGLKIKDLKYFGSQPWGLDSNLLVGYMATVDGDTTIKRDENELAQAQWMSRDELAPIESDISLTKTMLKYFKEHGNDL